MSKTNYVKVAVFFIAMALFLSSVTASKGHANGNGKESDEQDSVGIAAQDTVETAVIELPIPPGDPVTVSDSKEDGTVVIVDDSNAAGGNFATDAEANAIDEGTSNNIIGSSQASAGATFQGDMVPVPGEQTTVDYTESSDSKATTILTDNGNNPINKQTGSSESISSAAGTVRGVDTVDNVALDTDAKANSVTIVTDTQTEGSSAASTLEGTALAYTAATNSVAPAVPGQRTTDAESGSFVGLYENQIVSGTDPSALSKESATSVADAFAFSSGDPSTATANSLIIERVHQSVEGSGTATLYSYQEANNQATGTGDNVNLNSENDLASIHEVVVADTGGSYKIDVSKLSTGAITTSESVDVDTHFVGNKNNGITNIDLYSDSAVTKFNINVAADPVGTGNTEKVYATTELGPNAPEGSSTTTLAADYDPDGTRNLYQITVPDGTTGTVTFGDQTATLEDGKDVRLVDNKTHNVLVVRLR